MIHRSAHSFPASEARSRSVVPVLTLDHSTDTLISMSTDQDRTLKIVVQTLHDWWVSLGGIAWVLAGILLLVGIAAMLLLLRWIWNGGLSRQTSFGFLQRHRVDDGVSPSDC